MSFSENESEVEDKIYMVKLNHTQIRSLLEWIPKNYDHDGGEEGNLLMDALSEGVEIK